MTDEYFQPILLGIIIIQIVIIVILYNSQGKSYLSEYLSCKRKLDEKEIEIIEKEKQRLNEMRGYQATISRLLTKIKRYENKV